jgi:hypothetical protein
MVHSLARQAGHRLRRPRRLVDEEMGVDTAAKQLLAVADPGMVERNFVYLPYPRWLSNREADVERWKWFLGARHR